MRVPGGPAGRGRGLARIATYDVAALPPLRARAPIALARQRRRVHDACARPRGTKPNDRYTIPSGSSSSDVTGNGYSSTAALKTGVGGVKFINVTVGRKRRLRVSLGYDALFKGTGEVILVPDKGGLVC